MGATQPTAKTRPKASKRQPRSRICHRRGCGRRYQPKRWNQRYCQEAECQKLIRRWQAARRQAKRRRDENVQAEHAAAERARRERAKLSPQAAGDSGFATARGHAAKFFFSLPVCGRPGCHEPPQASPRNPAKYCGRECRQAVRNVQDRERKWKARQKFVVRKKHTLEDGTAASGRGETSRQTPPGNPSRAPPV